ncbi:PLP-dependent aminotransferase family protein [Desulfovibrio inopinatus]|uniref:aminotransferase-like domain-containing protein n=1 Tax=Desulfovibrio inopinatus TaxID=102109 RepID=UPI00041E5D4E|nr:PLP-dependent aminotransferase family protein [Desulfovibrio inopinatus]
MAGHNEPFRYMAVQQKVLDMIEAGTLSPGDKIPSLRRMSAAMRVSLSTVNQAYVLLEEQGIIQAKPKSGYFVSPERPSLAPCIKQHAPPTPPTPVTRGEMIRMVLREVGRTDNLPLGVANANDELLPIHQMTRIMGKILRENPIQATSYAPIQGWPELRSAVARHIMDSGTACTPDDIIITSGALEALNIGLRAVTRPGDNVLIQSPTYYCFLQLLEHLGLRAIEIPSCPTCGVCPSDVEKALTKFDITAAIFTPNYNNPDGGLTPDDAKSAVVRIMAERGVPLLEDEIYGDLHFTDDRPRSFKSFDETGNVLSCSSFSKSICPGYRIGWIIPGKRYSKCLELKATINVSSASPSQLAVAGYLHSGQHVRHLRRLRAALSKQMTTMSEHIYRYFPKNTKLTRPQGGVVLWVELDQSIDSIEFFRKAAEYNIGVAPGVVFSTHDQYNNFIRLSFGYPWSDAMADGIATLGKLATEMQSA